MLRTLAQAVAGVAALLLFVCAMVVVQGQRDEVRQADLALVLDVGSGPSDGGTQAQLDHAILLHRRGTIARILLTGSRDLTAARRYMVSRGAPDEMIIQSDPAASLPAQAAQAAALVRRAGADDVVVIAQPASMLRALKVVRDSDLQAYGSPARPPLRGRSYLDMASDTLREAWAYLGYLFLGR